MDADHLDIYGTMMQSKHHFRIADKVEDKSQLFITKDLPLTGVTVAVTKMLFTTLNGSYLFDIKHQECLCVLDYLENII
jgi:UDP-N-acetylmuramate--alanine ligase